MDEEDCPCPGHWQAGVIHTIIECCDEPHCDDYPNHWERQEAQVVTFKEPAHAHRPNE